MKTLRKTPKQASCRCAQKPWEPYLHLLPFFALFALIIVGIVEIASQSLGNVPGYSKNISLDAYAYVFTTEETLTGIGLSFYIATASTIPSIVLGVLLAWSIATVKQEKIAGGIAGRLPLQIPHALACVLIVNMFMPTGILARMLEAIGVEGASNLFKQILYFPNSIGIILEYIWKETGYVCFMVLPIMSGVSSRLGEAAVNLGASPFKNLIHVTIPYCMPTIRTVAIIVFVYTFGSYETPFFLGSSVSESLPVLAYSEYGLANIQRHRPIAMALNMVLILISIAASLLYYRYGVKHEKAQKGRF